MLHHKQNVKLPDALSTKKLRKSFIQNIFESHFTIVYNAYRSGLLGRFEEIRKIVSFFFCLQQDLFRDVRGIWPIVVQENDCSGL